MLPRVEDLEHSIQWTSLANDIDDLEKLRRRDRRGAIEQHTYQRVSMPEMQRACTVTCDDDRHTPLDGDANYLAENCPRWSWKPRTDFEREYFYKDYKDYYCDDAMRYPSFYEPSRIDRRCSAMQEVQRSSQPSPAGSPAMRSRRFRNPVGLEKEHFSDSREKLHEIFEYNRYLRRQFFASEPVNARQNCGGFARCPGARNHQEASKRYAGFGSTETLTSQSNQSSVSSINERKSRTQATRSPEDEEDALAELVGRNGVVASSRRVRRSDGDVQRDGKVLVNILPGNEIRRVNVSNVTVAKLDKVDHERSEGTLIAKEARFLNDIKTLDESNPPRDIVDDKVVRKGESLPKYVFGSAANLHRESREGLENLNGRLLERRCNRSSRHATWTIPEDEQLDSVLEHTSVPGTTSDDESYRDIRRSLPNLMILKRKLDTPSYVARAVNVPGSSDCETVAKSGQCREQRSEGREVTKDPTRSDNRGQSKVAGYSRNPVTPQRLTSGQRVKTSRIPPPLDLSRVNEQCERMEAEERRYLNNYSVDVAILRSHEDFVEGLLTVAGNERIIKNAVHGNDIWRVGNDRSREREDKRRLLSRPLHKSCSDLPLANELQSPQLVNNCKSSMSDLRAVDSAPIRMARRPIDPDAGRRDRANSLLFDQTSSIGGLQAGSALPSTVYGPIPYSQ
jgi:hypothetical protein